MSVLQKTLFAILGATACVHGQEVTLPVEPGSSTGTMETTYTPPSVTSGGGEVTLPVEPTDTNVPSGVTSTVTNCIQSPCGPTSGTASDSGEVTFSVPTTRLTTDDPSSSSPPSPSTATTLTGTNSATEAPTTTTETPTSATPAAGHRAGGAAAAGVVAIFAGLMAL